MHTDTINRLKELSNFQSIVNDDTTINWRERPELYDNVIDIAHKIKYVTRVSLDDEYDTSDVFIVLAKNSKEAHSKVMAKINELYGYIYGYLYIPEPIPIDKFVIALNDIEDYTVIY
jgi:hypothetical protein